MASRYKRIVLDNEMLEKIGLEWWTYLKEASLNMNISIDQSLDDGELSYVAHVMNSNQKLMKLMPRIIENIVEEGTNQLEMRQPPF